MIEIDKIEKVIDYEFDNKDLLQQAFVRRSYSAEHGGQNNEILEFIGDKALDLVVIKIMMDRFGIITEDKDCMEIKLRNPKYFQTKYEEGKFTDIKKDLVKKKALSNAMETLGLHSQLIMGKGDRMQNRQNDVSVKEDLFEAIIGAVTLDSDWDIDILTHVVSTMIDFDAYFNNQVENSQNFVGLVQEWFQIHEGELPHYRYLDASELTIYERHKTYNFGGGPYKCQLIFNDECFNGFGKNNSEARENCAFCFHNWLEDNGYIVSPITEAIGEPDEIESIRQLNELYQKGLISKPVYEFSNDYDEDSCVLWKCDCYVEENERSHYQFASTKKEAQRMAAYETLLDLIGEYDEEDN